MHRLFRIFLDQNFFLHWINLTTLRFEDFFGSFDHQKINDKWKKGILEQLLDSMASKTKNSFFHIPFINFKKENYDIKDLKEIIGSDAFTNFKSSPANRNKNEIDKYFSYIDWIIYDFPNEIGNLYEKNIILEQVLKRKMVLANQKIMKIDKRLNQIVEVILKMI